MKKVQIMGILNLTPDSFYDGDIDRLRNYELVKKSFDHISDSDIIDVGGESSRPASKPISFEQEIDRIATIDDIVKKNCNSKIFSIDTYKPKVAEYAIENGYKMVNDIFAGRYKKGMFELVSNYNIPIVLMHMRGTPVDMQKYIKYDSLIDNILSFFDERVAEAKKFGILDKNIILDPGIGFAKGALDNYLIIKNIHRIKKLGYKVLIGLSRKSFLSIENTISANNRLLESVVMNSISYLNGADILRVHDVLETRRGINVLRNYIKS
ncbi:MAG: dihydropteroate synthase [Candidatus Marinimicrobia bacterium]|nr:dihydropteroate synthase [Candidatus Neomarinimicrobiota bacterium]|tara:strand:+ start:7925 stop:8725 length:801 start_codon:yes stop_codon:yes gene_type:complete